MSWQTWYDNLNPYEPPYYEEEETEEQREERDEEAYCYYEDMQEYLQDER